MKTVGEIRPPEGVTFGKRQLILGNFGGRFREVRLSVCMSLQDFFFPKTNNITASRNGLLPMAVCLIFALTTSSLLWIIY